MKCRQTERPVLFLIELRPIKVPGQKQGQSFGRHRHVQMVKRSNVFVFREGIHQTVKVLTELPEALIAPGRLIGGISLSIRIVLHHEKYRNERSLNLHS